MGLLAITALSALLLKASSTMKRRLSGNLFLMRPCAQRRAVFTAADVWKL